MKIRLSKAVEEALDDVQSNSEVAQLLRTEKAVTLKQFAKMLGVSARRAASLVALRGGNILEKWRDPVTGDLMLSTRSVEAYLERMRDIEDAKAGDAPPPSPYAEGPGAYTVAEFAEMTGLDPTYVRTGLSLERIAGALTSGGALISGPWARWFAAELSARRARDAAEEARAAAEREPPPVPPPEDKGWVPVEEAARLTGMKPEYFRLGRNRGGIIVQRIPGKGTCVNGPGLRYLIEQKKGEQR